MNHHHKIIHCTVTNDLNQDQRMHRICTTLDDLGYDVVLIGRKKKKSRELLDMPFRQVRLSCYFQRGYLFYAYFNFKLFWYLMTHKQDILLCVDSDTLLPCTLVKLLKKKKLIFDAHEYFTEVPELSGRHMVKNVWTWIEQACIPFADLAITVNDSLANLFAKKYNRPFHTLYNVPICTNILPKVEVQPPYILYQGVLNKGRGLEAMIDAMKYIPNVCLVLAGEGDLSLMLRDKVAKLAYKDQIIFKGWLTPDELRTITSNALLGVNLLDDNSKNYYYSLANKFFDYMHAGVPSVNMNFPEYARIIEKYNVGYLLDKMTPEYIATVINTAVSDKEGIEKRRQECKRATQYFQWQIEAQKLQNMMETL